MLVKGATGVILGQRFNSLAPGSFECNFRWVISKLILVTDDWSISCEIALGWMLPDFTDGKQSGTKPNLVAIIGHKFGNHLCLATKIGSQC